MFGPRRAALEIVDRSLVDEVWTMGHYLDNRRYLDSWKVVQRVKALRARRQNILDKPGHELENSS